MKFLANMGISPDTVAFLLSLGHEATHLHAEGLDRLPDPEILVKARAEGAIVLTSDLDFGELLAASGEQLPSVVIFRLQDMHPASVNHYLRQVLDRHSEDLTKGAILSINERNIRARLLPI
jgi:predicted nuclease of predicted toxin-antitoxin system